MKSSTPNYVQEGVLPKAEPLSKRQILQAEQDALRADIQALKAQTPSPMEAFPRNDAENVPSQKNMLMQAILQQMAAPQAQAQAPGFYARKKALTELGETTQENNTNSLRAIDSQIEDYSARQEAMGPDLTGLAALGDLMLGESGTQNAAQNIRGKGFEDTLLALQGRKIDQQNRMDQLSVQLVNAMPMGAPTGGGNSLNPQLMRAMFSEEGTDDRFDRRLLNDYSKRFDTVVAKEQQKYNLVKNAIKGLDNDPTNLDEGLIKRIVGTFKGGNVLSDADVAAFAINPSVANKFNSFVQNAAVGKSFTAKDRQAFRKSLEFIKKSYGDVILKESDRYIFRANRDLGIPKDQLKKYFGKDVYFDDSDAEFTESNDDDEGSE